MNGKSTEVTTKGKAAIDTGTDPKLTLTTALVAFYKAIPSLYSTTPHHVSGTGSHCILMQYKANEISTLQIAGKSFANGPNNFYYGQLIIELLIGNNKLINYIMNLLFPPLCSGAIFGADLEPCSEHFHVSLCLIFSSTNLVSPKSLIHKVFVKNYKGFG